MDPLRGLGGRPFDQDPRVAMESRVIKSGPTLGVLMDVGSNVRKVMIL